MDLCFRTATTTMLETHTNVMTTPVMQASSTFIILGRKVFFVLRASDHRY